jgi:hypothetical protein
MGEKKQSELAKLKEMNFREKREYIWEYYKIPIVLIVVLLLTAGSLINTWFINPPKAEYLYIAWLGGYETDEHLTDLSKKLSETIVNDPEKETVVTSAFMYGDDPQFNMATGERLVAQVAAGQIDVMILTEDYVRDLVSAEFLAPLDELFGEIKTVDGSLSDSLSGEVVYVDYERDDGTEANAAFGIQIGGCPLFKRLNFYEQELYFCQVINTQKLEAVTRAIIALYE